MRALCEVGDIDPESGKDLLLEGPSGPRYLALFLVGGEVRAYVNSCPHQGRSLNWAADEFLVGKDGRLVCPHHGAAFELLSGYCEEGPCKGDSLKPVPVTIQDGTVMLVEEWHGSRSAIGD